MPQAEFTAHHDEHESRLEVHGEIDLATAASMVVALADVVAEAGSRRIVVDVGGVTFVDSTGLKALIGAQIDLTAQRRLTLRNIPPHLQRVLEITSTVDLFDID